MTDYATIAYLPVLDRLYPKAFLRNLSAFKTRHPIYFYSENTQVHPQAIAVDDPAPVRSSRNKVAVHNTLFLFGLRIARDQGVKRFLFLESDCRVAGDYWDEAIFRQAEDHPDAFVCGTPAVWNHSKFDAPRLKALNEYVISYQRETGFPAPVFTTRTHADPAVKNSQNACVFIMGAGGVYNTAAMLEVFNGMEPSPGHYACRIPAFDMQIGLSCNRMFGVNQFQKLPWVSGIFSSYGDRILTAKQRKDLLKAGKVRLVHQVKDDDACLWTPELKAA